MWDLNLMQQYQQQQLLINNQLNKQIWIKIIYLVIYIKKQEIVKQLNMQFFYISVCYIYQITIKCEKIFKQFPFFIEIYAFENNIFSKRINKYINKQSCIKITYLVMLFMYVKNCKINQILIQTKLNKYLNIVPFFACMCILNILNIKHNSTSQQQSGKQLYKVFINYQTNNINGTILCNLYFNLIFFNFNIIFFFQSNKTLQNIRVFWFIWLTRKK
eukprot:TRINITY_DN3197_c0_g1_i3.p4 TRINITY_DN3197_c0_g1~~TRINITY_DN3197_c0_g1_i3.p4  ORF type:complete len:217 (+),score=-12.08 TRINITY_DN3197_c0_g1_i3:636-1286(+)